MGLRFDPMGGGQFKQLVQQLIETEKQPVKALEKRKGNEEARLKLFQEFKNKFSGFERTLAEFSNFRKFRELKVDLGDGANYMGITVDKERAEPGVYSIQIDQLASRSSVITNGFADPDETNLGIGFVTLDLPGGSTAEIFVDEGNASLRGIASLINKQKDSPIRASVVKDASDAAKPWRLILTAKNDGADDAVDFPEFYFLDGTEDIYLEDQNDARNAQIALDGFQIETDSNQIPDFLTGVNLHLKQARPDAPFTVSITEDYEKISGKVKGLVDQVNGILEFINKQNQVDEKSDTRNTFTGDTSLQSIEFRIRNLLHEGFPVPVGDDGDYRFVHLNQVGVEFTKTGMLQFNAEKFQKNLEADFNGISEAITGEFGMANQLRDVVAGYTRAGNGMLSLREKSMRDQIKRIDQQIADKERLIERKSQALVEKFSRLQGALGKMQSQQAYLAATLPGAGGGGGNLLQQLMGG